MKIIIWPLNNWLPYEKDKFLHKKCTEKKKIISMSLSGILIKNNTYIIKIMKIMLNYYQNIFHYQWDLWLCLTVMTSIELKLFNFILKSLFKCSLILYLFFKNRKAHFKSMLFWTKIKDLKPDKNISGYCARIFIQKEINKLSLKTVFKKKSQDR